jgi:acetylglutamate kinase
VESRREGSSATDDRSLGAPITGKTPAHGIARQSALGLRVAAPSYLQLSDLCAAGEVNLRIVDELNRRL